MNCKSRPPRSQPRKHGFCGRAIAHADASAFGAPIGAPAHARVRLSEAEQGFRGDDRLGQELPAAAAQRRGAANAGQVPRSAGAVDGAVSWRTVRKESTSPLWLPSSRQVDSVFRRASGQGKGRWESRKRQRGGPSLALAACRLFMTFASEALPFEGTITGRHCQG
jgi:hypothetical protein